MQKQRLDYFWRKQTDKDLVDVICLAITEDAERPDYYVHNLKLEKTDIDIDDCYLDEKGDLYVPTMYLQIKEEVTPEQYVLLKTKKQIEEEYANYKQNER